MKEIHWKSLETGLEGHCSSVDDDVADRWVLHDNETYRTIYYWTVKVV